MDNFTSVAFLSAALVQFALPFILWHLVKKGYKADINLVFWGFACFFLGQVFLVGPFILIDLVLGSSIEPFVFITASSIATGTVEEVLRYLVLLYPLRKVRGVGEGLSLGVGWGAFQTVLIGLGLLATLFYANSADSLSRIEGNLSAESRLQAERLAQEIQSITVLDTAYTVVASLSKYVMQLAWTLLMVSYFLDKNPRHIFVAIGSHIIYDFTGMYLSSFNLLSANIFLIAAGFWGYNIIRKALNR